jgi:pyruvate/2-oxoglutarate/acetoin dehydrogenase E1 component
MTTVLESLNRGLHEAFAKDERVYLIGEDILDPYGGAFKVSKGLSTNYKDRVWTSPVSEAGIVGIGTGMALRGLRPVVEIMFGDFSALAADQVINSLTKFHAMYNGQVSTPLVIRTPMGGRRGYGPTHSQTLEKIFMGVPGLRMLAANCYSDPGDLLRKAILQSEEPTFFVENKLLYSKPVLSAQDFKDFDLELDTEDAPAHLLRLKAAPAPRLTMAAYGYMAELARQALLKLAFDYEIFCELYVPSQLAPFPAEGVLESMLAKSIERTGRLMTIEEGTYTLGWGAEVLARAAQEFAGRLKAAARVAAADQPIPASFALESDMLPGVEHIVDAVQRMV